MRRLASAAVGLGLLLMLAGVLAGVLAPPERFYSATQAKARQQAAARLHELSLAPPTPESADALRRARVEFAASTEPLQRAQRLSGGLRGALRWSGVALAALGVGCLMAWGR